MKKTLAFLITVVLFLCTVGSINVFAARVPPDILDGYYQIKSVDNFEWFLYEVNGSRNQTANAKLCSDIDVSDFTGNSTLITTYQGIFDGQGYSIKGLNLTSVNTGDKSQTGLFGELNGATVTNLTLEGTITDDGASETPTYIGGLAARAKGNTVIENVLVNVNITEGGTAKHVGGIVGSTANLDGALRIEKCFYNGTINVPNADDCIGGIIGYANENVYIKSCGSIGTIGNNHASAKVGGILGYVNNSNFKELSGCYSDMTLTTALGNDYVGSIIGWRKNAGSAAIKNNVGTSVGDMDIYGGYTETASDAYKRTSNWTNSNYAEYLNGDAAPGSKAWVQSLGINGGYPVLRFTLPDYGIVLTRTDGGLPNYKYDESGKLTLIGGGAHTLQMKSGIITTSDFLIINSPEDVTLTLSNVNINCPSLSKTEAIRIMKNTGKVTILLSGTNNLSGGYDCAALYNGTDLTIDGTGSLAVTGGEYGAGIGGASMKNSGAITINGGTVTATGGGRGAGIGAGYSGDSGVITINGGNVTAMGGTGGSGIGVSSMGDSGAITINGGVVNATGGSDCAGINAPTITITDGEVTATGGERGAGIGGGNNKNGGTVIINGGTVTATGGECGAGIGGGNNKDAGTVIISGGTVTATGGANGAGIGGGSVGGGGVVTINGGNVTATGQNLGAGIGRGGSGKDGTFSTGVGGNAFVVAKSISDKSYKTNSAMGGIITEEGSTFVGGDQTLTVEFTVKSGKILTVTGGSTLTVADSGALINNGTVNVEGTLALPADTEANEALFNGISGSGKIVIGEKTYSANGDELSAVFADIKASLGEDISLTYYIDMGDFATAPRMRFTINGYTTVVEGKTDGGQYAYKFTGISPQRMGDTITAELLDEVDTVIGAKLYSVLKYLNRLKIEYSEEAYPELNQLINDLLVYGGAAQVFTGYKTEALVSKDVAGSEFVSLTGTDKSFESNGTYVTFNGATVNFNSVNRLKFRFTAETLTGVTFKLRVGDGEGKEIGYEKVGDYYVITTEGITADGFDDVYTVTAYNGNEQGAAVSYSVKSYVYAMQAADTDMAELAKATYNYGLSAKAFLAAE